MTDLQVFSYQNAQVRTVIKDGDPWFVAKDVCDVLKLGNTGMAVSKLDDEEKGCEKVDTLGGTQDMTVVSEAGLYTLIIRSNMPEAKPFRKWVTGEVLPSIRKHGVYATPQTVEAMLNDPDTMIKTLTVLKEERAARIALQAENAILQPKAEHFDRVMSSKDSTSMEDAAKVLRFKWIGRNTLFSILREKGILMKNNRPYQEYIDRGYFRVIEREWTDTSETVHIYYKTMVEQKGLDFIRKLLMDSGYKEAMA